MTTTGLYALILSAVSPPHPAGQLLFRITEGFNRTLVLKHGTDRHGRPDKALNWHQRGYSGAERRWGELIYASTVAQVQAAFNQNPPGATCCFDKLPTTPNPIVLVYDRECFEQVREREHALRAGCSFTTALIAAFSAQGAMLT